MLSSRFVRWLGVGNQLKHMQVSNRKFRKLEKGYKSRPKDTSFWAVLKEMNERIDQLPQRKKALVGAFVMLLFVTLVVVVIAAPK